jgi:hypothetical protein
MAISLSEFLTIIEHFFGLRFCVPHSSQLKPKLTFH